MRHLSLAALALAAMTFIPILGAAPPELTPTISPTVTPDSSAARSRLTAVT